jgi:type 1 fimbria pilin
VLYDNGGSGMTAENPGGWWLNNLHLWNNSVHGVYMDTGTHGVKINGLYVESFGLAAAASTQYFGLRLRTFNAAPSTNTVPVMLSNVSVQTTDPAGTSTFYCISVVGDGTDAHAYLTNVHALGAATARGFGIELYSASGTMTLHESGVSTTGFNAGQAKMYNGTAAYAYDPPRVLTGTASWTPGAIGAGAGATQSVTVTGAALGDPVAVGYNQNLQDGLVLTGEVSAANTVTAQLRNVTAGSLTPTAGTVRATVWKH